MSVGELAAPVFPGSGFLFTTIRGELHEIHAAVRFSLKISHQIRHNALNVVYPLIHLFTLNVETQNRSPFGN